MHFVKERNLLRDEKQKNKTKLMRFFNYVN